MWYQSLVALDLGSTSSGELPTWVMMNPSSMFSGVESTCPTTAIDCFDELTRKIWRIVRTRKISNARIVEEKNVFAMLSWSEEKGSFTARTGIISVYSYFMARFGDYLKRSGELPTWVMMNPSSMFSGVESTCLTTAIDCFDELTRKIWQYEIQGT
ncbi:hypothetical protein Tco_0652289 [Tanacetum coccineum]|uniref:Uncharacterized protein n=1 Tax=Tanacetum coccineum TaxID=301880 RepID=A0ABQ4WXT2_9ASTR